MNKHITWISVVLDYADNEGAVDGHRPVTPLRFKTKHTSIGEKDQSKKQRARDARSNWNRKEIKRLLEAPVWHGCAGLDDRFLDGTEVYHDAWYWLPLMYVLYGGRSSELAGLRMDEVFEKDGVPYFQVDYNDLRALKNAQSIRKLPIHPELIRLGFIGYVAAMRELGHKLLFPEIHSPRSKSFSSTFYKSVFTHWRSWAFPKGTSWQHQVRGAIKDKDVHSFRGVASSLMQGKRLVDNMTMRRVSQEAQRNYLRDVGRFATWLGRSPHTATAEDVRRFQIEQQEAGVACPANLIPPANTTTSAIGFRMQASWLFAVVNARRARFVAASGGRSRRALRRTWPTGFRRALRRWSCTATGRGRCL